jgi:murein DD-endopeptidase MepM/ murein hydrolase activator NlpD
MRSALAVLATTAVAAALAPAPGLAYGWPVRPFDRQHPVRGSLGDPRTIFFGPPSAAGLAGDGRFGFHMGVDISARDGTAVHPVESGVVTVVDRRKGHELVRVASGAAAFEYWHITATVRVGQKVSAGRTRLGRILRGAGHVHLTELDGGRIVNPLGRGHLAPYRDTTRPSVDEIAFRAGDGSALMPSFLRGVVEIVAEAHDTPAVPVPGLWHGMPVTPALVAWRIEQWNGKVVLPETIAYDVRGTTPPDGDFWRTYARGTYQNMSVFGSHYSWLQPGCFLFRLTPSTLDTARLEDGVYSVVVTATDVAGNSSSASVRFTVANHRG